MSTSRRDSLFDLFNPNIHTLHRAGVPVTVHAKALPPGPSDAMVGRYTITATLDRKAVATGDAVTLHATIEGTGNVREARPVLGHVDGLRILPPQVQDQVSAPNDFVTGTRTMDWLIVPERPGTYTIPALELSTFDPASSTYATAKAGPFTLTAAGAALATDAQNDASTAHAEDKGTSGTNGEAAFGPVRADSALERAHIEVAHSPWYPWLFGVPPFAWLGLLAGSFMRRRLQALGLATAPRRAARSAKKRLSHAEQHAHGGDARAFYGEVARALKEVLEARLGETVGGLTHDQLRAHLRGRGMALELADRLVDELEGTDFARFSATGVSASEMRACLDRNLALIERLDHFDPLGAGEGEA